MLRIPFLMIVKMSVISLKGHKIRTSLALLGIVIGISAFISTVAFGTGAEKEVRNQIMSMGNNFIMIQSGRFKAEGKIEEEKWKAKLPLIQRDYDAIQKQLSHIEAMTPVVKSSLPVFFEGKLSFCHVKGTNENFMKVLGRKLKRGYPMTKYHVQTAQNVAVLGSRAAKEIFEEKEPIGKIIYIKDIPIVVIGVLDEIPVYRAIGDDPNLEVFTPITFVRKDIIKTAEDSFHYILLSATDSKYSSQLVSSIRRILRFRHHLREAYPDDFIIWDQKALLEAARRSSQTLNLFLMAIAAIALIVGGIGIMNIMLVSMFERKKEIGIRMAIGASPAAILVQFLSESVILCLFGGVIGIFLGLAAPYGISYFTKLPAVHSIGPIFLAFLSAFAVGLFFGFYPAYQASKLDPIKALKEI